MLYVHRPVGLPVPVFWNHVFSMPDGDELCSSQPNPTVPVVVFSSMTLLFDCSVAVMASPGVLTAFTVFDPTRPLSMSAR